MELSSSASYLSETWCDAINGLYSLAPERYEGCGAGSKHPELTVNYYMYVLVSAPVSAGTRRELSEKNIK